MSMTGTGISDRTELVALKRKKLHGPHRSKKRPRHEPSVIPGGVFQCFTIDGDDVNVYRRSAFSSSRKEEVKDIRRKGACLRCRLLKRACSGEDPCKTCLAAARAASGSRALSWMECIRPSFQTMNIFNTGRHIPDQRRIEMILNDLLDDDVSLDFHIPFSLNVDAASAHLASWLCDDYAPGTFSVVGVFSCSTNTSLLQNALDPNLGRDLRLFVHLTTHLYTTGMQGGYQHYSDDEIQSVRDVVGNRLLNALDPLLRPTELEGTEDKLGKLKSLFMLLLGVTVGMRYTCPDIFDNDMLQLNEKPPDPKQEALLQLLCHYLIYIGKVTSLLESSSEEKALVNKWKQQWNKPAAFTWNSSTGLEMHYRIQPPADWIISSSEDESMSSINLDLTDFEDSAEFTINTDLLKCAGCDTFWATLDAEGLCPTCAPPLHEGGSPQSNLDADFYSYFLSDDSIESSFTEFFNMPSLPHSPIANGMKTIERSHGCQKHEADEISNIQQSICPILRDLEPYTYNSTDSGSNLDHQTPQLLQTDQRTRRASPTISDRFETSGDNGQMEAQDATNSTTGHLQHAFETAALKHTSSLCSPARKNTSTAQHFQDLPSLHDDRDFAARSAGQSIVELARCPKCYEKSFPALKGRFSGPICGACRNTSDCSTNPLRFTSEPCTPAPHVDTRYSTAMKDSRTTTPIPQFHKCGPYHSNPVPLPSLVDGATIPLRHPEKCTLQDPNLPIEKTRRRFTCSSCYKVFHRQDNFNRHEKKCGQPRSFATTTSNTTSRVSASIATSGEFSSTAERGNEHTSQWICPRPRCLKICTSERFLREHLRQCHPNNLSIMRPVDQGSTDEPISKTEALDTFPFDDSSQQAKIDDVLPPQHDWPLAECDLFIPPDENWPRELQHDCRTDMLPGLSDQPQNASVAATPFGGLDGSSIQRPRLLI